MTSNVDSATETARYCAQHPDVETELACGRCGTLICPRCLIQTPVGARCRACARLRRPPMYTLAPLTIARLYGAAALIGVLVGAAWGMVLPLGFGFFALFLGMFAGYGMARAMEWAGGHKRGPLVQGAAVAGIILAYCVHNLVVVGVWVRPSDLWGLLFVGVASVVAWNQLR